ncbi:hypothetical protein AB0K23_08320 [Streptomyces sp. NPDC049602]|uniref:hypothetical protein n=1 Tax=Streptomyces sp. NPDC049602 TaxID=3155504 RepID=UPI003444FFFB
MGYGATSKMLVNLVDGCAQAKNVAPGSVMWTLDGDRTVQTTVVDVTAVKGRQAVDVVTDHMTLPVSPDLLLLTPDGWTHAADVAGATVAWTHAKKLCRATGDQVGVRVRLLRGGHVCRRNRRQELSAPGPAPAPSPSPSTATSSPPHPTFLVNGHLARGAW